MVALQIQFDFLFLSLAILLGFRSGVVAPQFIAASSMAASLQKQFPVHPGQACSTADGKMWALSVRRLLPADWLSLLDGVTPRSLLQYTQHTVPTALAFLPAVDAANPGVPQTSVLSREMEV